jgi:hypothetical protein
MAHTVIAISETVALRRFLSLIARRLWFIEWLESGRDGLWRSGILLLLLGGIHVILTPVPVLLIALMVAGILMGVLIRGLRRRPTLSHAAAQADRRFRGHAVMTTAVEYLPNAPDETDRASGIVLKQAAQAARDWQPNIQTEIQAPTRRAGVIALVPLFIAAILLTRPGADGSDELLGDVGPDTQAISDTTEQAGDSVLDDVATLRRELADDLRANPVLSAQAHDNPSLIPVVGDASSTEETAEVLLSERDSPPGSSARAGDDPGDSAGDALPRAAEPNAGIDAAELEQLDAVVLQRTGTPMAGTDETDLSFAGVAASIPYVAVEALAAAAPESGRDQTTLTRAQAAYAARYLKATGDTHD